MTQPPAAPLQALTQEPIRIKIVNLAEPDAHAQIHRFYEACVKDGFGAGRPDIRTEGDQRLAILYAESREFRVTVSRIERAAERAIKKSIDGAEIHEIEQALKVDRELAEAQQRIFGAPAVQEARMPPGGIPGRAPRLTGR